MFQSWSAIWGRVKQLLTRFGQVSSRSRQLSSRPRQTTHFCHLSRTRVNAVRLSKVTREPREENKVAPPDESQYYRFLRTPTSISAEAAPVIDESGGSSEEQVVVEPFEASEIVELSEADDVYVVASYQLEFDLRILTGDANWQDVKLPEVPGPKRKRTGPSAASTRSTYTPGWKTSGRNSLSISPEQILLPDCNKCERKGLCRRFTVPQHYRPGDRRLPYNECRLIRRPNQCQTG